MVTEPHLFFADASLDLSRGDSDACIAKLEKEIHDFRASYTFHALYGRALKTAGRYREAFDAYATCCRIAPWNQVAWKELVNLHFLKLHEPSDPVVTELEHLSRALSGFAIPLESETCEPTTLREQKQPFSDEEDIPVPTESLAELFCTQNAYKKAINVYSVLMDIYPDKAALYKEKISELLEKT